MLREPLSSRRLANLWASTGWKPVPTRGFGAAAATVKGIRSMKEELIFAIKVRKSCIIFTCDCPNLQNELTKGAKSH